MNILVLYKDSAKGGLINHTKMIVNGLKKRNFAVVIAGPNGTGTQELQKENGANIIDFSVKNPIKIIRKLNKIIKNEHIDIIHAQNRIPAFYADIVCKLHKNVSYVWANDQVPIPHDFFHRISTKYGQMAITCSVDGYKMLKDDFHIPKDKIKVVNIGVNEKFFTPLSDSEKSEIRKRYNIGDNEKIILLYGRLAESKGHMFFLKALSKVKSNDEYKVLFPGDGSDEYKRALVSFSEKHGLKDRIVFTGFADGYELLSISDLMVLPSSHEGYSIACIEALCMGVPVIRTKTGGYEETKEYCTGVDYDDVEALSSEIELFFSGNKKFQEKAQKALLNREKFGEDTMIDQYVEIYQGIMNKAH